MLGLPTEPVTLDLTNMIVLKAAEVHGVYGRRMFETWSQTRTFLGNGLEPLTKPFYRIAADERTAKRKEGRMDIHPPLVAHPQSPELIEPGHRALDHPAMSAQPLAGLHALARDASRDPALA